jgi:hypothetical protein
MLWAGGNYTMDASNYIKVSVINLCFLVAGIIISPAVRNAALVYAQTNNNAASKLTTPPPLDPNFEYVSPQISGQSAAFETLISHRLATDQLMANGYDVLKLENNTLTMLVSQGRLTPDQARQIADASKVEKPLRLQPLQPQH